MPSDAVSHDSEEHLTHITVKTYTLTSLRNPVVLYIYHEHF
jgi:hypothetical protein